ACPRAIWSCAAATACVAEAQARLSVYAGISLGNWGSRLTSRATLGIRADGTTCPKITSSTVAGSRFVRSTSSRAASRARSTPRASLSAVPALQNGVRHPETTATRRRPFSVISPPLVASVRRGASFHDALGYDAGNGHRTAGMKVESLARLDDLERMHHQRELTIPEKMIIGLG